MKIIGITGKSGSGKTTLSKMLERDSSIGVIHLDEILNMKEIKKKLPSALVDKNIYSNGQGEEIMILDERIRKVKEKIISNKLMKSIYFGMLYLPIERLIKKTVSQKVNEGKQVIIIEGAELGKFTIYNELDYLILINAPFIEREKRVVNRRDLFFDKKTMVNRDLDYKKAAKKARKKGKKANEVIQNTGTIGDLQKVAERIYNEQIKNSNTKQTMKEKYGGHIIKPVIRTQESKTNDRQKDGQSK